MHSGAARTFGRCAVVGKRTHAYISVRSRVQEFDTGIFALHLPLVGSETLQTVSVLGIFALTGLGRENDASPTQMMTKTIPQNGSGRRVAVFHNRMQGQVCGALAALHVGMIPMTNQ